MPMFVDEIKFDIKSPHGIYSGSWTQAFSNPPDSEADLLRHLRTGEYPQDLEVRLHSEVDDVSLGDRGEALHLERFRVEQHDLPGRVCSSRTA